MTKQAVFGLAGWSGSGKTTLAEKLISQLAEQGYCVATIKHAHHKFDADIPGKDSWRHRKAGAKQVLVSSATRSVHFIEHAQDEPELQDLLDQLSPCDLVLVEGFKKEAIPKLEIYRHDLAVPPLYPEDSHIIALVSDTPPPACPLPVLESADIAGIVDFILGYLHLEGR
jgi:molybdopterin-guanine dinucleotide biosynthesis protein B